MRRDRLSAGLARAGPGGGAKNARPRPRKTAVARRVVWVDGESWGLGGTKTYVQETRLFFPSYILLKIGKTTQTSRTKPEFLPLSAAWAQHLNSGHPDRRSVAKLRRPRLRGSRQTFLVRVLLTVHAPCAAYDCAGRHDLPPR